jgi:hypothetical protein
LTIAAATITLPAMSSDFPLESLLALAEAEPPHLARQSILNAIMAIDYAGGIAEKVCRLDERLAALRAREVEAHARILESLELGGEPPTVPPSSVEPAFIVLTAVQTAIEKLDAARAALRRKAGPGPNAADAR